MWVRTGSRDEAPGQAGISHLVEHMVFKGTTRRRMHQIASRMEAVGGYLNAFTSKEHTCYHARALDKYLGRAVETTCDLVCSPIFPERELIREKTVVLEEMKMYEDTPEEHIFDRFESVVFPNHALGRPVIGYPKTVTQLTRSDLCTFVQQNYTPDRIVVSAAGNLLHQKVEHQVERAFATLRPAKTASKPQGEPAYAPSVLIEERPMQQAHLVLGRQGISVTSTRHATIRVLNTALGVGMSSRLSQNIREKYGFCYNIFSFVNMHSDCGDFGVYMGTDAARLDRSQKLIVRELDRLAQSKLKERTLRRVKNQIKGNLIMDLEHVSHRMQRLARQELLLEKMVTVEEDLEMIDAVTADDVHTLAQELFDPSLLSRVIFVPGAD